jgi:hypothetical protein
MGLSLHTEVVWDHESGENKFGNLSLDDPEFGFRNDEVMILLLGAN